MDAKELIRANRLTEARARLIEEVKGTPGDQGKRTLLFQVLSFFGEWDKADRHLDILAMGDARADIGVQVYKNLIAAEKEREEVISGKRRPSFMATPPPYLDKYFIAWDMLSSGKPAEAAALYGEIEEESPEVAGKLDGKEFKGMRDTDQFLSGFLELFVHEHYLWMPFASLREISIPEPKTLLDLIWIQGQITTWEGLTTGCYIPVLYPGSAAHENDLVRLGKMTDWKDLGEGFWKGMGQHVFLIGDEEKAILDIREIQFTFTGEK